MGAIITLNKDLLNKLEKSGAVYKLNCKKYKASHVRHTGRYNNTRAQEHKKNLGRKCIYPKVLSDKRNEYTKKK